MLKIKVLLDKRRATDQGLYPIKVRFTEKKKTWYLSLGIYCSFKDWNPSTGLIKSTNPSYLELNQTIQKELKRIHAKITLLKIDLPNYTLEDVKALFQVKKYKSIANSSSSFQAFAASLIQQQITAGREGNAITYRSAVKRINEFIKKDSISFDQINYNFIVKLEDHFHQRDLKINSIAAYMKAIRAIYNQAIKAGKAKQEYYPFNKYQIKTQKTLNRTLTLEQMKAIKALELPEGSGIYKARDYFMASFYLIGINFIDLAKLTTANIHQDRIIYIRSKTKKHYSIKITKPLQEILNRYKDLNTPFLFPIIKNTFSPKDYRRIAKDQRTKINQRYLRKLGKLIGFKGNLSTYYARYTWANLAKQAGYSKDLIAEALGHEYGNKVTGIYLDDYGSEVIDEMNLNLSAI